MDLNEAIKARHSVRSYTNQLIEGETERLLRETIEQCNAASGLNIQLILNEPKAFGSSRMARYGKFSNVNNYLALVGKPGANFHEKCGYYGEKIVLLAQQLGLNTCWVAMTYSKSKSVAVIGSGEKRLLVIAIGYGDTMGVPHKVKPIEKRYIVNGDMPEWFQRGMESVKLAPTAINQQKFCFKLEGETVKITPGFGFYTKVDMGIAKYHFEVGSGRSV